MTTVLSLLDTTDCGKWEVDRTDVCNEQRVKESLKSFLNESIVDGLVLHYNTCQWMGFLWDRGGSGNSWFCCPLIERKLLLVDRGTLVRLT